MTARLIVAVPTPVHSAIGTGQAAGMLSYAFEKELAPGTMVVVPLGRRKVLGIVWDNSRGTEAADSLALPTAQLRWVERTFESLGTLSGHWRKLVEFAAQYYQRSLGEVAHSGLPPLLRDTSDPTRRRRVSNNRAPAGGVAMSEPITSRSLTQEQIAATMTAQNSLVPSLLFGATGSGKTEVYLQLIDTTLNTSPAAQVLVLVPEINLTPQFEDRLLRRFTPQYGTGALTTLHSGLTPRQRLNNWLSAHQGPESGGARIILGTRTAIFASMPGLRLIVVDEEHDASYKSQDASRYSARDLAIFRGKAEGIKVILGSATPSLESWVNATRGTGKAIASRPKYTLIRMPTRIGHGPIPRTRLVAPPLSQSGPLLHPEIILAIQSRVARKEQVLILLNRRGYAPVLGCAVCAWKSDCPNCSAHQVFHKRSQQLQCHHCGASRRVPRSCPSCGNPDIKPLGTGTEKIEEALVEQAAGWLRPDGNSATVLRLDADSTRKKGALLEALAQIHEGVADVVIGTQMIAKGHDFRRVSLAIVVNPDSALFSADFRAPERLFAMLLQVAGRAGRDDRLGAASELWIQTAFPTHPVFQALRTHDFEGFAENELKNREEAGMPPFTFQALIRADAREQAEAQEFLSAAVAAAQKQLPEKSVTCYAAIPLSMPRVARIERAQLLVESASRKALQGFLHHCLICLQAARTNPQHNGVLRWFVDVDPIEI